MIKLLIGIIFLIVAMVFKLIVAGIGAVSTVTNKRGTFINFGTQYLKQTNVCYRAIVPYMSQLVDDILIYSKYGSITFYYDILFKQIVSDYKNNKTLAKDKMKLCVEIMNDYYDGVIGIDNVFNIM